MALSVNWVTKVILVLRADMTLLQTVPTEIRELNLNAFRLELRDLEDNANGRPWQRTHDHNTTVTVSGTQLARVVNILDPYTITFEDGQYAVNLIGANSNVGDRVNVNQVSVRSSNSAGLVQTKEIEDILYGSTGAITIDENNTTGNAVSGQANPIGTHSKPSDNIPDSLFILNLRGYNKLKILGNLMVSNTQSLDDITVDGDNPSQTTITFIAGCTTSRTRFINAELTGTLNGALEISHCHIEGLSGIGGNLSETNINNSILETAGLTLSTVNTQHVHITNCRTGPPDNVFVPINFNGTGGDMTIAQFNGQIEIQSATNNQNVKIFMNSGRVRIAASCTALTIHIHGDAEVIDNSISGVILVDKTISTSLNSLHTKVPDIVSLANINIQMDTALNTIIPGTPTLDSINDVLSKLPVTVKAQIDAAMKTDVLTEAYAGDGVEATLTQLLYMLLSIVSDFSITGSTISSKKIDGLTVAMTHSIDSTTNPTLRSRTT